MTTELSRAEAFVSEALADSLLDTVSEHYERFGPLGYGDGAWEVAEALRQWVGESASARIIQVGHHRHDPHPVDHVALEVAFPDGRVRYLDRDGLATEADFLAKCRRHGASSPWIGEHDPQLLRDARLTMRLAPEHVLGALERDLGGAEAMLGPLREPARRRTREAAAERQLALDL